MTTLAEELATDPLGIGYAGMTDAQIEESMAAATRVVQTRLDHSDLLVWAASTGAADVLEAASKDILLSRQIRSAAQVAMLMLGDGATGFDTASATNQGLLAALVAGVPDFTQDMADALMAMGQANTTRWQELGWGRAPTHNEIGDAR